MIGRGSRRVDHISLLLFLIGLLIVPRLFGRSLGGIFKFRNFLLIEILLLLDHCSQRFPNTLEVDHKFPSFVSHLIRNQPILSYQFPRMLFVLLSQAISFRIWVNRPTTVHRPIMMPMLCEPILGFLSVCMLTVLGISPDPDV